MKRIRKVEIIIILVVIISVIVIFPTTLTMYKEKTEVSVSTKSGELIYDVILDNEDTYLDEERNTPYFLISVKNTKDSLLTDVDFDYTLVIKNKNNSNGLYSYVDDTDTEITPVNELSITGTLNKGAEDIKTYKIYIYSTSNQEDTVEYDVDYEIVQKRMD